LHLRSSKWRHAPGARQCATRGPPAHMAAAARAAWLLLLLPLGRALTAAVDPVRLRMSLRVMRCTCTGCQQPGKGGGLRASIRGSCPASSAASNARLPSSSYTLVTGPPACTSLTTAPSS
jgi:hypothetical protein